MNTVRATRRAWPPARLAARRHAELRNSLAALDVDELRLLGYEDGGCERRDGTAAIAGIIAEIKPDLIVTFGPDGMTGHPDHRAISRWTTEAWAATRPAASLWYATVTPEFHRQWGPINDEIGLWADQPAPPCASGKDLARSTRLADDLLDLKIAAVEAHNSQTRPPHRPPRPGDLPRVVAHGIVPRRAGATADERSVRSSVPDLAGRQCGRAR